MKFINKIVDFFMEKPTQVEMKRLSVEDYDKLVDTKLEKIRKYINCEVNVRDGEAGFSAQLEGAFLKYENAIKMAVKEKGRTDSRMAYLSPNSVMQYYADLSVRRVPKKIAWHKQLKYKIIRRKVLGFFRRIKFKTQLYYQHIMLMREIRKMKKTFPMVSNQHAFHLINATKLNKRMIENRI